MSTDYHSEPSSEGIGHWAARQGLTGLGYVASVLDKPGRATRAALDTLLGSGQHAQDIASILPFSDTLGLTRPEEEVGGAELLKNVTGYDPTKGNWLERNIVPFATETLTDPTTFLGGIGGLTKAGKAAEAAGKLERGLIPGIKAGQRSLLMGMGTGERVAQGLEETGSLLRKVPGVRQAEEAISPLATKAKSLFDVAAGPVAHPSVQESYRTVARPWEAKARQEALGQFYDALAQRGGGIIPQAEWDALNAAKNEAIQAGQRGARTEAFYDVLGKHATGGEGPIVEGTDVASVLRNVGLGDEAGLRRAAAAIGLEPGAVQRDLFGTPLLEDLTRRLGQHQVAPELASSLTELMKPRPLPPPGPIAQFFNPVLQQFKRGVYSIWPGSQVKNLFGGRVQSFLETGQLPVGGAYGHANEVMQNLGIDSGIADLAHLTPELQSQALKREAFVRGVIGQDAGRLSTATVNEAGNIIRDPTRASQTLRQIGQQFVEDMTTGGIRNPLGEQGAAVKMGQSLNNAIESNLRMGEYIGLRQQGWKPDAAAQKVFQTHFDYSGGMSEAEKKLWGNVATFPTFSRFNIPKQIGRAVEHPGQAMAMIRASQNLNRPGQDQYIPGYQQEQLSFPTPLGGLSNLGLGVEDLGNLSPGRFAGMMRPELALPLSLATGVELGTGRPLAEKPPSAISRTLGLPRSVATTLDAIMGATPYSRVAKTVAGVASPSSWEEGVVPGALERLLPLATGAKISQQTPEEIEKLKLQDLYNAQEAQLRELPEVRAARPNLYIPPELREQTPQDVLSQLQAYRGTGQQLKAARQRLKQAKGVE